MFSLDQLLDFLDEIELLKTIIKEYMPFASEYDVREFEAAKIVKVELDSEEWMIRKLAEKKAGKPTFIYLMHNERNGYYKIGRANNVEYRERTLQGEDPQITTIHTISSTTALEKELHHFFSEKRIRGEWFNLSQEDVDFIKSLK